MIMWLGTDMERRKQMVLGSDLLPSPCCAASHCSVKEKKKVLLYCYSMYRKQNSFTLLPLSVIHFSWEVIYRNSAAVLMCITCLYNRAEVPNDEVIARVFQDALRGHQPCSEHWAVTSSMDSISMHVSCEMVLSNTHTQLLFLQGKLCTAKHSTFLEMYGNDWRKQVCRMAKYASRGICLFVCLFFNGFPLGVTLEEMCVISAAQSNVVPVRSEDGRMRLLDFSAPFLFRGDKRYYGWGLMIISVSMLSVHWGSSLVY